MKKSIWTKDFITFYLLVFAFGFLNLMQGLYNFSTFIYMPLNIMLLWYIIDFYINKK